MHGVEKFHYKNFWGEIKITTDIENQEFFVQPLKGITPELIKKDLQEAINFSEKVSSFDYIVDISKLYFAHPVNFFYLLKLQKIPQLSNHYVISKYALQRFFASTFRRFLTIKKVFSSMEEYRTYKLLEQQISDDS